MGLEEPLALEARYSELLESMPDGILLVDSGGRILFANARAAALFGYEREELQGMLVELLLPERFRGPHTHHRSEYVEKPGARTMGVGLALHGLRKNGSEFPVDVSLSPLEVEGTMLIMSAIRDITERKRIEQALHERNVELAGALRARSAFLATMSHELRTPLNAIIGFTGTLLMRLPGSLTTEQEKQLQTVQASGKHLLALINDLLDLAKIDAGKLEVQLEPTDCRHVIEEVAAALRPLALRKGLEFISCIPQEPVVVSTDRRMLSQIVLNLVNNAIKFTERGSVIIMLEAWSSEGRKVIDIAVHDTGTGIRPEDRAKLFVEFEQLPDARKTGEGSGLGLHLSQKLAELLGGRIEFRSEYGEGSSFSIRIGER